MTQADSQSKPAYIGLGSNLDDRKALIFEALKKLDEAGGVSVASVSSMIETSSLGEKGQPNYLNVVAATGTTLSAGELLKLLQDIESSLGRIREERWGPRTIDMDLLLYGESIIESSELTIPHSQMHLRSFVLQPICELAADLVHPVLKRSMTELAGRLNGKSFALDGNLPQLISIAGIIGVGKTTLAKGLAEALSAGLILEAYDTNPYIAEVYAGKKELALDSQLYFLDSRAGQLNKTTLSAGQAYVTDYIFDKEMIYAGLTLDQRQLEIYKGRHDSVVDGIAKPVVVIYLQGSAKTALDRIHQRNRPYEQQIALDMLDKLSDDYERLFADWHISPVIRLAMDEFNCLDDGDFFKLADEDKSYIWKVQEK